MGFSGAEKWEEAGLDPSIGLAVGGIGVVLAMSRFEGLRFDDAADDGQAPHPGLVADSQSHGRRIELSRWKGGKAT